MSEKWDSWPVQDAWDGGGGGAPPAPSTYDISGAITGDEDTGVTVTLSGDADDSVVTEAGGAYIFEDLVDGDYVVTPELAGYEFTPESIPVTVDGADAEDQDFVSALLVYDISGTVTGDEDTGVTITLSGDADDTFETEAGGAFSFADLPPGDYVLTPTLAGYTFAPESINVTVVAADKTDQDFVSSLITYTISGTITGTVVEGVTITLSGDADDSTTTDVNGDYEFTGLVDGSYTVTPTLAGYAFAESSEPVVISGDNVAVDDMVSYVSGFIGFNEDTLGGVAGSVSDWVHGANHAVTEVVQTISSDQGSHTPSQATKQVFHAATSQESEFIYPCGTLPRTGKVRVALLARGYDATYRQWGFGALADGVGNYLVDDMWNGILDLGGNPDTMDSYHRTAGADIAYVTPPTVDAGVNNTANRWVWQRVEFDYDASQISMHTYQPAGGLTGTVRTAAFPTGFENNVFTKVYCRHGTHALYGNVAAAGIWIGTGADSWPTT